MFFFSPPSTLNPQPPNPQPPNPNNPNNPDALHPERPVPHPEDAADDARHKLALRLVFGGDAAGAVEAALDMVKRGDRERGRALCVRLFDALGANDPLAQAGRRRLSNLWFV